MRIRFRYIIAGETGYFEIKPRDTGRTIAFNNLGAQYTHITVGDKEYISRQDGAYENLLLFSSAVQQLTSFEKATDPFYLREREMYYDHSVAIQDLTAADGQLLHYDDGAGTAELSAFIRTEIDQGQQVPHYYFGGLFNVSPTGSAPFFGSPAPNVNGVYTTLPDEIPRIDFALFNVSDGGQEVPCILCTILHNPDPDYLLLGNPAFIFDTRLFDGAEPTPTTEDGSRTVTPWGRTGTYNFTSDQMVDVPPSGFSIINRWDHGLTLYHINDYQLAAIQREFWGNETLWGMWINATVKPIQGVITLHKMPVPISSGASSRALTIFGRRISSGQLLDQIPLINDQLVQYPSNPQWVPIEEIYGDFFDYAGESQLSVHLPFIGTIPLDINAVMNGAIKTVYYFDLLTGNCIARVYGRNGMMNGAELLLYQGSGNAALHIPYCGNDQGGMKMLGSLAGVATAGLAALAIGGAAAAPAMAAITGTSSAVLRERNATVNNIPTECAPLSYPYVCYIMTYPERVLADYEMQMQGWRAASGAAGSSVSDYKGFTAGYVHADISAATDAEKAEIERYFEGGVIL